MIKIIECPRDAWQGLGQFVPTDQKIDYINQILMVGFDTVDFGSFVSPKAIPQMKDTFEVTEEINWWSSNTDLLAIVANLRGAEDAMKFDHINYLGFPLSLSETFQQRNTNKTIEEALVTVKEIKNLCDANSRKLVIYLSMGFGNPYGDPYDPEYIHEFVKKMAALGVGIVSLADTIGVAKPMVIEKTFQDLIPAYPDIEFGAHLHSTRETAVEKIDAAFKAGCKRFDGAVKGFGGCPMAKDELVGNIPTELLIEYFKENNIDVSLDPDAFKEVLEMSSRVFG